MKKIINKLFSRMAINALLLLAQLVLLIYIITIIATRNLPDYVIPLVILCFYIVSFIFVIVVINTRMNANYKISWLLVILALPPFGVIIYILFANKKISKRKIAKMRPLRHIITKLCQDNKVIESLKEVDEDAYNQAEYIRNFSGSLLYANTKARYFPLGDDAFPIMLQELLLAKHYIFLEYFIIQEGVMWNSILEILKAKAQEGLDVRVMYDDLGSIGTLKSNYCKVLKSYGIKAFAFNRFRPVFNIKVNNRDHRKILVIDGHTGFTGGINLADEYINQNSRFGHWKDNAIMLKGPGVYGLTSMFIGTWDICLKAVEEDYQDYLPEKYMHEISLSHNLGYVQPYGDTPFDYESVSENVYVNLITRAKKFIYITTPYLIIDDILESALCNAAKQKIDVRILTPHIPDKKLVFNVTRSYYKVLLEAGVKIYEYTPGFVHCKMFVVDDVFATVGTVNLDYRSLFLHMECGTWLYKTPCIKKMKEDYLDSLGKSQEITLKDVQKVKLIRRIFRSILRVFAPLL